MATRYDRFLPLREMEKGQQFVSLGRTVTEADCVLFTSLAGLKAPVFVDEEHCKKHSRYGKRVVPGLLTAALTAGMMEDILGPYVLAALGLTDLTFELPIFHGDTVSCTFTVLDKRDTRKPEQGIVDILAEMHNQDGNRVFRMNGKFLMTQDRITD